MSTADFEFNFNGSTYSYFPKQYSHNNVASLLHEVVIANNGIDVRTAVDYLAHERLTYTTFTRWVECGMPSREEYDQVFDDYSVEDMLEMHPLDETSINKLYDLYKSS